MREVDGADLLIEGFAACAEEAKTERLLQLCPTFKDCKGVRAAAVAALKSE